MRRQITFIRHAQSEWVLGQHTYEFPIDCDLTEIGTQQAGLLDLTFDVLIISPLKRSLKTFEFSKIKYNTIIKSELLKEKIKNLACPEDEQSYFKRVNEAIELINGIDSYNIGIISHKTIIHDILEKYGHPDIFLDNAKYYTLEI